MDPQTAMDMIAQAATLTDHLDTQAAEWLLRWAGDQVSGLLESVVDEELAQGKLNALMAVMRKLNQIADNRQFKTPDALVEDVRIFVLLYTNLFGQSYMPRTSDLRRTVKAILRQPTRDMLAYLLEFAAS